MNKILEKLKQAANISEEDLKTIKESFDVEVKKREDEETKIISEKADEWTRQKVDAAIKLKSEQLNTLAETYCNKKAATIARKADRKIHEHIAKLEKLTKQYITEYFAEKFQEKYGEELALIESKVVDAVDNYLSYAVTENIKPELIAKTAINETIAPLVKGIQNLFEEQYVPLNVSGTKKIKEANRRVAELESKLQTQLTENIRLSEAARNAEKHALIAEKTASMDDEMKEKVKNFFESKDYESTKSDIDTYCELINEYKTNELPIANQTLLHEKRQNVLRKKPAIEDGVPDFITEKFKPVDNKQDIDNFLLQANQYLENAQ